MFSQTTHFVRVISCCLHQSSHVKSACTSNGVYILELFLTKYKLHGCLHSLSLAGPKYISISLVKV